MIRAFVAGIAGVFLFATVANAQTCGSYTNISNNTPADATQVMTNFNSILTCANTALAPLANPHFTGSVGIATSSPADLLSIGTGFGQISLGTVTGSTIRIGSGGGVVANAGATSGTFYVNRDISGAFEVDNNGAVVARFELDGGFYMAGATGGSKGSGTINATTVYAMGVQLISDGRLKTNVRPLATTDGLDLIHHLDPVTFQWADNAMGAGDKFGFLAQDVEKVAPNLVATGRDRNKTLTLDYIGIIPPLVRAVQQLDGRTRIEGSVAASSQSDVCEDHGVLVRCSIESAAIRNQRPTSLGLSVIEAIRPVSFNWKASDQADIGLVAEDVGKVSPLLASYQSGKPDGVKYGALTAVLINAVHELAAANKTQAAQLDKQSSQIVQLKMQMGVLQSKMGMRSAANVSPLRRTAFVASVR